jgi:outer membrane murein-binding lipoprotein Lpp
MPKSKIEKLETQVKELQAKNKFLSSKLIEKQEDTQGALQFLDALENLLLDHGFKVVSINE